MLRRALLWIAISSLLAGLWISWALLQRSIDREHFLSVFNAVTVVWFLSATAWAYMRPRRGLETGGITFRGSNTTENRLF